MTKRHPNLTLPNALTILRLALIPACGVAWVERSFSAIWLFAIAAFTDLLDGFLARALDQVSPLGKDRPGPSGEPAPLAAAADDHRCGADRRSGWAICRSGGSHATRPKSAGLNGRCFTSMPRDYSADHWFGA
jgi:hypothetical protein